MGGWGRHADSLEGRRDNMLDDKAGQSGVFALCFISVLAECHFLLALELIAQAGEREHISQTYFQINHSSDCFCPLRTGDSQP